MEFYQGEHGHTFWPSSPCVPHDDPTLLFTNAGMNQYKPLFLGQCDPSMPMYGMKSAVNSQKCIRAGGKHNDLDDVGKDVYHHTYFEMLGSWSFGDYFKHKAIKMAWECLTVKFGLNPDRLYVTYFGGDAIKAPGVPADEETRQIWLQYVPAERISPFDAGDNFWEMGDIGPCGPCTEIHYDRIGGRDASKLVNVEPGDPDVIEIWNVVFIQYNREADGLKDLPSQHVDTGMGFERLTSILQDKRSNYDTDVFTPLFAAIQTVTGAPLYEGRVDQDDVDTKDMAYRVLADHIRTLSFAIADGARPDSVGRGYVLRRILRRAVYFGRFLGVPEGQAFFSELVPVVVDTYGDFFKELGPAQAKITRVIRDEEAQFNKTIAQGMKVFEKKAVQLTAGGCTELSGADAFFLASSMGFPLDLTEIMCEQRGMTVDKAGFEKCLEEEKAKNLVGGGDGGKDMVLMAKETAHLAAANVAPTDQAAKYEGGDGFTLAATVMGIFTGRGDSPGEQGFVASASAADGLVGVVLNASPFYAQAGGQVWDTGTIALSGGATLEVANVQVYAGYVLHLGTLRGGANVASLGDAATCCVDYARRQLVVPNHTMTHVLNFALRQVLMGGPLVGDDVGSGKLDQKGSDCNPDRLRFDFAWDDALSSDQLQQVEAIVNQQIADNYKVFDRVTPLEEAQQIYGLRAVFGEAYPDPVRVVSIGVEVEKLLAAPTDSAWAAFSVEFCGGTHLPQLSDAELFVVTDEGASSAGVRRIAAVTRAKARECVEAAAALSAQLDGAEQLPPGADAVAATKALKKGLQTGAFVVGQVAKYQAAVRLALLDKSCAEYLKTIAKEVEKAALDGAKAAAAAGLPAGQASVLRLDFGNNGKVNSAVMKLLQKACPTGAFLVVSADADNDAVCVFGNAGKVAGVDAKAWCDAALAPLGDGATSGGKAMAAMGSGPGAGLVDAVVAAAKASVA